MTHVLGVDPGLHGGFAVVNLETKCLVDLFETPRTKRGTKNEIEIYELAEHIDRWAAQLKYAVVEDVSAMTYTTAKGEKRGQGAAASFAFGKFTGVVHGILASYCIPIFFAKPAVWKLQMGLTSKKQGSLDLAKKAFPAHRNRFSLQKNDGVAEAALLALFGAERFK